MKKLTPGRIIIGWNPSSGMHTAKILEPDYSWTVIESRSNLDYLVLKDEKGICTYRGFR